MKSECWKDVKGYEGIYKISNKGKVKSMARETTSGGILANNNNGNGYMYVTMSYKGVQTREYIHRLVALHFIKNINNAPEVNHKNAIKEDNKVGNLEWVTRKENVDHAMANKLRGGRATELDITRLNMVIDLFKNKKYTIAEIKEVFDISDRDILEIRNLDKELKAQMELNRSKRNSGGNPISIYNKNSKKESVFDSAVSASRYYGHADGYFSELITKNDGENIRYIGEYVK